MALAALISAYHSIDDSEQLRATLPLAGGTVIEHQARQAMRAGASHVVILVERLPAALTNAIDALRRDGLAVDIARSVADAADRIHPDERLLLIADGCVAAQASIDRIAATQAPALLTLTDEPDRQPFERMDGATRWAGVALLDGARLRETSAMLGDWDIESTLLRRAVQEGAARVSVFSTEDGAVPTGLPIIAEDAGRLAGLERQLLTASRRQALSWPERYLFSLVEERAANLLLPRMGEPQLVSLVAGALALVAIPLALVGWAWGALIALLLAGPVEGIAERMAAVRLASIRRREAITAVRAAAAAVVLAVVSHGLAIEQGWGWRIVGALTIGAMLLLREERNMLEQATGQRGSIWLATVDGMIWAFVPFAIVGRWDTGLAALALYATFSLVAVQRRLSASLRVMADEKA